MMNLVCIVTDLIHNFSFYLRQHILFGILIGITGINSYQNRENNVSLRDNAIRQIIGKILSLDKTQNVYF